jgi:tryptophan-rich sensory protein
MLFLLLDVATAQRTRTITSVASQSTAISRSVPRTTISSTSINPTITAPTFAQDTQQQASSPTGMAIGLVVTGFIVLMGIMAIVIWRAKKHMHKQQVISSRKLNRQL